MTVPVSVAVSCLRKATEKPPHHLSLILPPACITVGWRQMNDELCCAAVLSDITEAEGQFLFHQTTYFVSCSWSFNFISFFKHLACCFGSLVIFLTEVLHT